MAQSILITGGGTGIGRATAHAFRDAGWRVGVIGRREEPLRETATGSDMLVLPADVTRHDQIDRGC